MPEFVSLDAVQVRPVHTVTLSAELEHARQRTPRLANVERLRAIAMLEIVCYHDSWGRLPLIAGIGLPAFLLITNVFNCTLTARRGLHQFLADKLGRLALPWLFWNLAYGLLEGASAWRKGIPLTEVFSLGTFLSGTYLHLWFVPFALFSAAVVAGIQSATRDISDRWVIGGAASLGAVLVVVNTKLLPARQDLPLTALSWLFSLPSTFLGLAIGRSLLGLGAGTRRRTLTCLLVIGAIGWPLSAALGGEFTGVRYLGAVGLVAGSLLWAGKSDPLSQWLSPFLFGIYLVHPLVARVLEKVPFLTGVEGLFAADFLLTAVLVAVLHKTPMKRFL